MMEIHINDVFRLPNTEIGNKTVTHLPSINFKNIMKHMKHNT